MRRMNNHLLELMHNQGMWAVSIPGGLVTSFENGELNKINKQIFKNYLALEVIPVGFGDVTIDTEKGVTICSGDDLVLGLSSIADKAVFVTNVDGIYKEREVVKIFEKEMYPLEENDFSVTSDAIDVTGGMNKKVEKMMRISQNCDTYIVNGEETERLRKILDNEEVICTEVRS